MIKLPRFLKRLFSRGQGENDSPMNVQELRAAFTARYHSFKLLLTANNKALEIMSDLEKALEGNNTFGMAFVRSNCTAVSVNVFRIVKNLDELAPGKYRPLFDRFKQIQDQINQELVHKKLNLGDRLVIPLSEIRRQMADQVGSKMANVAEIKNEIGLPVPSGFVVSALAYQKFVESNDLQAEIDRRIQAANIEDLNDLYSLSAGIQQLVIRSSVPDEVTQAINEAFTEVERESGKGQQ